MALATGRFTVMALGFGEVERKVLIGVIRLSERRNPGYTLVEEDEGILPDIFLVDADDPEAMHRLAKLNPNNGVVAVLVGEPQPAGHVQPAISRPLQWGRVLKVLDDAIPKLASGASVEARGNSVLVVDDSLPVRVFMNSKLEPLGLRIDYAESGEAALAMAEKKIYDVIFLDVIMGGMDGYQVCKEIKSKRERRDVTRVVMLTSKGSPFDKVRGAMAGCDAYLTKPVDEARLNGIISKFLSVSVPVESNTAGIPLNASWRVAS